MTKRQFVVLVFRMFALYFTFNFIESLGSFVTASERGLVGLLLTFFTLAVVLFFVSLLWRKSEWLMQKIFAIPSLQDQPISLPSEHGTESDAELEAVDYYETPISAESLQLIAFSLFGLHEILNAIPHAVREAQLYFQEEGLHRFDPDSILPMLFQLGGGIWLLLRPWQLQDWIAKFHRPDESDTSHEEA